MGDETLAPMAGPPSPEKPAVPVPVTVFSALCPLQSARNANPRKAGRHIFLMKPLCASALLVYRQNRSCRWLDAADLRLNGPVALGECGRRRHVVDRDSRRGCRRIAAFSPSGSSG